MERFRQIQSTGALVLCLLLANNAQAQTNAELFQLKPLPARLIPEYSPCTYQNSRFACFTAEQMVELNTLEIQARYWHDQWEDYTSLLAVKEAELLKTQEQISIHLDMERQDRDQINVLNNRLSDEIEAKNEWRAKAENPPIWPLWVGGTTVMLSAGFVLGCLIGG